MPRLPLLLALLWPATGLAQVWEGGVIDDGAYFEAGAGAEGGLFLSCGGPSAGGLTGDQTGNTHPRITPPGAVELILQGAPFAAPADYSETLGDLEIRATDGRGYRLPPARWNPIWDEWSVVLHADSPLWSLMAEVPAITVSARGRVVQRTTSGFAPAFAALVRDCARLYAAVGQAWPAPLPAAPPAAAPPAAAPPAMDLAARTHAAGVCGAPPTLAPDAILTANLDGDGQPDAVLDLRAVTCPGRAYQDHCGAAACDIEIFVSRLFPTTNRPETILGVRAKVAPLSNGLDGVIVGGVPSTCTARNAGPDCRLGLYWTGTALAILP